MRSITLRRTVDASSVDAWDLLVDVRRWPSWGTSIRSAELDDGTDLLGPTSTGSVTTVVGVSLPFRVSEYVEGRSWRWHVAGVPATGHGVRRLPDGRCEVSIDVPWFAAPYAAICRVALADIAGELEA